MNANGDGAGPESARDISEGRLRDGQEAAAKRHDHESGDLSTTDHIAAHLAATQIFSLLEPASLARLARAFERITVTEGTTLARQGRIDQSLWILIAGSVSIDRRHEDGRAEHLGYRGYGAVIGTRGVFTDEPRGTSAVALEQCTLLEADRDDLWAALGADRAAFDRLLLPDVARRRIRAAQTGHGLDGEQQVGLWRHHWIELVQRMVPPIVFAGLALIGAAVMSSVAQSPGWIAIMALLGLTLAMAAITWAFFDYYQDRFIVTTRRVVHIERTPFIDAQRSEAMLSRIQDVHVLRPGLVATLLGYGTIRVTTAGSRSGITFSRIPKPKNVREIIFAQMMRERERVRRERRSWLEEQVRRALGWPTEGGDDRAPPQGADEQVRRTESNRGFLHAFLGYIWPKMRVEEQGVVIWRMHWWILLRQTILPLLALALVTPLLLGAALDGVAAATGATVDATTHATANATWLEALPVVGALISIGRTVPAWLVIGGAVVIAGAFLYGYEDWRNDRYMLTDDHIIDIEALPLGFFEDRRQASIAHIQDISYRVPNVWASLLNYGHVVIETAADSGNFTFDYVYHPELVQREIFERMEMVRLRQEREAEERNAEEMSRWLAAYHRVTGGKSKDDA